MSRCVIIVQSPITLRQASIVGRNLAPAGTYPSRQRCCAVLTRSANAAALAPIRVTNAAALFLPVLPTPLRGYCCAVRQNERQLPSGSGETQGVLLLRSQAERKAASASHSGEMKGEGAPLHFQTSNQA